MNKAISFFTTRFLSAIIVTCFLGGLYGSGVTKADADVSLPASVLLPIPNRLQDPDAPPEGWCGETTIQMGMAYYKKEVSQKVIHAAGKPVHPDLYSNDIDTALDALGVQYLSWRNGDLLQFVTWIKTNLAKGYPVFCGVKINPTKHPEWSLDHFVLAVGYNDKGLYINTNNSGDGQILIEYPQLSSVTNRYSFENQYHRYFGRALTGLKNSSQVIQDQSADFHDMERRFFLLPSVQLQIPNRSQDPDAPALAWDGETCIQMGMAYFKMEVPQKEINSAGKPKHSGLYSDEINRALDALGVQYLSWGWQNNNILQFIAWIETNLAKGYPVLCGIKINPTRHPEWPLDHFVLVVGYNEKGLYINTNNTGDGQILVEYSQLLSLANRYSFENPYRYYFGRALTGVKEKPVPKLKPVFVDSSKLKRLAGRYKFGVLTRIITFDGKNLYDQSEGGSKRILIPLSETEFDYDDYEDVVIRLRFELSGDKVIGVHHRIAADVSEGPLLKRMEPIEDKNPQVTALVQQYLRAAMEGTLKPEIFTPNLAAKIFPDQVNEVAALLKSLGPQTGIDLYEREEMGSIRQYLYRVSFGDNHVILRLALMEDNRIFKIDFNVE